MAESYNDMTGCVTISVIIPLFNCAACIEETLDSIQHQTILKRRVRLEVCICDDGSTDGSVEIVRSWQEKSSQIQIYLKCNTTNVGPGESRNEAVQMGSGEYLAMLDADDVMLPERLEQQLTALQCAAEPDTTIVGCFFQRIPADSTPRYQASFYNPSHLLKFCLDFRYGHQKLLISC
jgi:glycosyltransferase involved in cell wall biosynthesis